MTTPYVPLPVPYSVLSHGQRSTGPAPRGSSETAMPRCPPGYQATKVNGQWHCLRVFGAPLTSSTSQYGLGPRRFAGTLAPVTMARGAGPFAGIGRALGSLTSPFRPRAPIALAQAPILGLGAVDLTDQSLMGAAQALYDYFQTTACSVAVVPEVRAFQQAWLDAGGTLPNDTGGRSPVDGFYGANTAAALQQMFTGAPAGCVGAAPSGGGAVAATNPTQSVSTPVLKGQDPVGMYFADVLAGGSSLWWTLGIVGIVAVVAVSKPNAFKMYPGAKRTTRRRAKKAGKRRTGRHMSRSLKRGGKRKGRKARSTRRSK